MIQNIEGVIQELTKSGYHVVYINGTYRKLVITGELYRAEIGIQSLTQYKLTYYVESKGKATRGSKGAYIAIEEGLLMDLRNTLEPHIKELIEWVYDGESFAYTLSRTTGKVKYLG